MSLVMGLVAALVIAVALVYFFPEATEKWLMRVLLARKIIFGVGIVILALFLLATSAGLLPIIGGAILVLVFLYLLVDPQGEREEYLS